MHLHVQYVPLAIKVWLPKHGRLPGRLPRHRTELSGVPLLVSSGIVAHVGSSPEIHSSGVCHTHRHTHTHMFACCMVSISGGLRKGERVLHH